MSQTAPKVVQKQIGLQKYEWIEPKELNAFINVLLERIDKLEADVAALKKV